MPPDRSPTVLIVEDDRASLLALEMRLGYHGWRTVVASSAAAAVDAATREGPDVILLDLGLPDSQGIETIRLFTRRPGAGAIPVVVLSGEKAATHRQPALAAGAASYLEKPADVTAIVAALEAARSR